MSAQVAIYLTWLRVAKGQRPRTVEARRHQLGRFDRWMESRGRDITTATHVDVLEWLPITVGPDARRTYTAALSGFFTFLQREGIRSDNPTDRVPRPPPRRRLPKPVTDEDAAHIWTAAPDGARIALGLAMMCGLRVQEVSATRWEHVEWGKPTTLLVSAEGAKGGHERRVVVPNALTVVLRERRQKYGWMARGPEGQGSTPELMGQWLRRILHDELGVEASPHQLRHWYATTLLRRGANVRIVQDALGHASLATTALYMKVTIADQATHATELRP